MDKPIKVPTSIAFEQIVQPLPLVVHFGSFQTQILQKQCRLNGIRTQIVRVEGSLTT